MKRKRDTTTQHLDDALCALRGAANHLQILRSYRGGNAAVCGTQCTELPPFTHAHQTLTHTLADTVKAIQAAKAEHNAPPADPHERALLKAEGTAERAREVINQLLAGQVDPEQARLALYALQLEQGANKLTSPTPAKRPVGRPRGSTHKKGGKR